MFLYAFNFASCLTKRSWLANLHRFWPFPSWSTSFSTSSILTRISCHHLASLESRKDAFQTSWHQSSFSAWTSWGTSMTLDTLQTDLPHCSHDKTLNAPMTTYLRSWHPLASYKRCQPSFMASVILVPVTSTRRSVCVSCTFQPALESFGRYSSAPW